MPCPTECGRLWEGGMDDIWANEQADARERLNAKLEMLKAELAAMREMDIALLKQFMNISRVIHHIHRPELLSYRSMSFVSPAKTLFQPYPYVERQYSAPPYADQQQSTFSTLHSSTDDFTDSIMSFDRSGFTSLSELDTSTSSLNTISSSLYSFSNNSLKLVQSHDLDLTLTSETVDESDQTYEDILKRNIRFWKIGLQT